MSGFTKGKWKYSEELQQVTAYPEGPGNWPVVGGMPAFPGEAPSWWKDITGELCWNGDETDANGRLIAAAPEMYKALLDCAEFLEERAMLECEGCSEFAEKLLASVEVVIARAEGRKEPK